MSRMSACGPSKMEFGSRSPVIGLLALFVVSTMASLSFGQTAQLPISKTPALLASAEDVSLDLVVNDKKDRPILDLKPEEIAITDEGATVKLNTLRLVSGKQDGDHLVTLVFDRPQAPISGTLQPPQDPYVLHNEMDAATKILKMFPDTGFSFSVMRVEGRLRLFQGFTSDRKALEQAVKDATIAPPKIVNGATASQPEEQLLAVERTSVDLSGKPVSARDRALDHALFSALNNSGRFATEQHLRPTMAGLLALVQSQQQLGGRKAVIYFTFFKDNQADSLAKNAIKSIIGAADRAGVSIYVVDLNSADTYLLETSISTSSGMTTSYTSGQSASTITIGPSTGASSSRLDTMNEDSGSSYMRRLAEGTGGIYIGGEGLRKALKKMMQDMTTYYEASYTPPIQEYDGKFRSVAVKPLRTGLQIRTRTGYFALPPHDSIGTGTQPFELPLVKILGEQKLPTDLAFRTAILKMGNMPDGNTSALAIEAPLSGLEIREDPSTNLYSAHVSIVANIKDKTGEVIEHFSEDIPRRGVLNERDAAKFDAITLQRHFIAPPGHYVLEAAVLDLNSNKAGAQRVDFEIPNTSALPSLSEMVLVRQTEPFNSDEDPSEPLQYGKDKVKPNLSGQLPPGAKNVSVFFIAHSDAKAPEATLGIQVFRDGKPLKGAPMTSRLAGGSGDSSYLSSFSVNPPRPGLYEVRATLSQGGKTTVSGASFTMAGAVPAGEGAVGDSSVDSSVADILSHPVGPLAISVPTNPIQRPAPDELKTILADATKQAVAYSAALPNFMCEQVTDRSIKSNLRNQWRHKDRLNELLTYVDHQERRTVLESEQNGQKSHTATEDTSGAVSAGEFGGVLSGVFEPSSKAEFQWTGTGMLGDGTVQIFDYRVTRENSKFWLQQRTGDIINAGFHGQVFIDTATRSVRRITMVTDDVSKKSSIHASSVSVDYDYAVINDHDYLMPIGAQVIVSHDMGETDKNEIEFRNFRRFGSTARIVGNSEEKKPQK